MKAMDWVRREELQQVINEWAYSHYSKGDNPQYLKGLETVSQDFKEWCELNQIKQTSKGYTVSNGAYQITLVEMGGLPIYIEIQQPYVFYRINIYLDEQRYTIQVQEPVKESIKARFAKRALSFGF